MIISKCRKLTHLNQLAQFQIRHSIMVSGRSINVFGNQYKFGSTQQPKSKSQSIITSSPYKILQVEPNASAQQIKSKFYELAQKYHPDHSPSESEMQKFKSINQAYQILKDPQKRKQLDFELLHNSYGSRDSINKKYSYTRHNYGYGPKNKQQASQFEQLKRRQAYYNQKPGYSSHSPDHRIFQTSASQQEQWGNVSNPKLRKKNLRVQQSQQNIKTVLIAGVVLVGIFAVVQLVFKVYQFNNRSHKEDAKIIAESKIGNKNKK